MSVQPLPPAAERVFEALLAAATDVRHAQAVLIEALQAKTRTFVDEYNSSQAGETRVTVGAQTTNLELIEFIFVQLPTGTTSATLTLPGPNGTRSIALQNTTVALGPLALLVPNGPRVLTYAPAGAAYLELMGVQLPTGGVL